LICTAPCREHTSKVLRYGTGMARVLKGSQQFYLHILRSSANGMNHIKSYKVILLNNTLTFGDVLLGNITFFDFCCFRCV